ncbi:CD209 antigen-like protein E [Oryzias latipes]|uniref:CD209 antigen-like protein E n=1 Tax=Oryzias latipes TaxID=8090 RepID=UPI000CE272D3|nr:CD209 antigen-like protein E [Oryzias latipes]
MSSDIYAKPDFSKKVRYNRKQQEDTSDWEECEVEIYNDAYESVEDTRRVQSPEQAPQTETCPKVQKRFCRCEQWCLLVLCTVLSAGSIILSSFMVVNINNLQMEVKELKKHPEGKLCPEGWRRFGCSCYFKSTEQKTWIDSRSFCQFVGFDLVVVNSKEEQEFVSTLNQKAESWIGLFAERSSDKYEWKWVDGSLLTETFWDEKSSKDAKSNNAVSLSPEGKWKQQNRGNNKNWICEKNISKSFCF